MGRSQLDESRYAVAVIVDISRSRTHPDRRALQAEVVDVLRDVNGLVPALQPLEPTVGDEFQGAYTGLSAALRATLLVRLRLPDGAECRFGIGLGELRTVGTGAVGSIQDGSAWWSARRAIGTAREHEYSRLGFVRTWFATGDSADPEPSADAPPAGVPAEHLVNAYLLCRDQMVGAMQPRARRLLLGQLLERTQAQLAREEGISQSAVSQSLSRSGATALLASETLILGGAA
ncbi:MAG: hypothetical protein JWM50_1000 [Microbacteriaceae bacterium]|jgi:hypothetical protein|nr:hypothetical protein [Microbacteriaceae bacterium]